MWSAHSGVSLVKGSLAKTLIWTNVNQFHRIVGSHFQMTIKTVEDLSHIESGTFHTTFVLWHMEVQCEPSGMTFC